MMNVNALIWFNKKKYYLNVCHGVIAANAVVLLLDFICFYNNHEMMKIAFRYLLSRMPLQAFHTPVLMHMSFCAAVNMQEIKNM